MNSACGTNRSRDDATEPRVRDAVAYCDAAVRPVAEVDARTNAGVDSSISRLSSIADNTGTLESYTGWTRGQWTRGQFTEVTA